MRRCRVKHPAGIDGVAMGAVGDFPDNAAVQALVDAGLLVPIERERALDAALEHVLRVETSADLDAELARTRAQFDASWAEREAAFARELGGARHRIRELEHKLAEVERQRDAAQGRVTEMEVEVAQLRLDLEAATAPAKPAEG